MPSTNFRSHALLSMTLALAACLSACAPGRMALPATLSKEAKPMPVQKTFKFWIFGLKQLDFGTYKVSDYHSGWQQGSSAGVKTSKVGYDADKSKQKFEFKLTANQGQIWAGRCAEAASKRTVSSKLLGGLSADLERQATLDCTFQVEQGQAPWILALSLQTDGKGLLQEEALGGELTDGTRKYRVKGINEMEGMALSSGDPTGFSIQDEAKVLGAVQIINKPLVWMDPAVEPDLGVPLAMASTALMLQKGLLKQLDSKE